jgi:hypothetical protein
MGCSHFDIETEVEHRNAGLVNLTRKWRGLHVGVYTTVETMIYQGRSGMRNGCSNGPSRSSFLKQAQVQAI